MPTDQLGPVVRRVGRAVRVLGTEGLTDGQLLEHYVAGRDEAAFEALVGRHGPMVFGVCLRLLRDRHDAEDAFQATFLVLVRKAASVLPREMVANWLYGVACQTAVRLRSAAARRRRRETNMPDMPEPVCDSDDAWDDLRPVLDHELRRLPERYRVPVVLCDLEGKTRKEAARHVGCPEGTLSSRLSRARSLLARRLARHGLGLSGAALGLMLSRKAAAGPPAALTVSTVKAAGGAISASVAALTEGVLKAMLLAKLKTALKASLGVGAALLLALAALVGPGRPPAEAAAPAPAAASAAAPAPAHGRVAVFNLTAVVKGCAKFKTFQEETKADLKKYEDRVKKKQAELDDLRRRLQNMPQGAAPELEAQARAAQREIEDVSSEAKRQVGDKTDKQTVELYKDIQAAVRRYAKDHDLDLVLHYSDAADGDDALSAANVSRKLQAGACVPIFAADGVDITAEIVNALNGK